MDTQTSLGTQALAQRLQDAVRRFDQAPVEAVQMAERIVAEARDFLPARRTLARMWRVLGEDERAGKVELDAIALGITRPEFRTAQDAFLAEDLETAELRIRAHLRSDPQDPAAAVLLGEIAARMSARQEAENLFRRAIQLAPAYSEARNALARHYRDQGRYDDALTVLGEVLAIAPDHVTTLSLRAAILSQMRRMEDADAAFAVLHKWHPDNTRGWADHAHLLKTIGRQSDAIAAYRQALAVDPAHAQSWWGLSNLKTVRFTSEDVALIRDALASHRDMATDDRVHLLYTLGKAHDDRGEHALAFAAYAEGAALRLESVPHDPEKVFDHVRKSEQVCTPTFFEDRKGWGSQAPDPIFIVSLPRSGSTLVEQILASHPQIEGTEELYDIERIALSMAPDGSTGGWLDALPGLPREKVRELGEHYVEATRRFRETDRRYFTDKMPSNWVFAGLIATILPNAKIIDIRRHPLGCGFANFAQHFNWGINYSYDLAHIGQFYAAYVRQMAHFDDVLPGRIHHLTYEALVEDTEAEVRRLMAYLGLPFAPACLRFFENNRAVFTPSSEQVRSPINREGMERWQRYEPFLEPLKEALGPVLQHYPETPPRSGYPFTPR